MDKEALDIQLGHFYLRKSNNDYDECKKQLLALCITKTEVRDNKYWITLRRPGLLIGPKGRTIEALSQHFGVHIHIEEERSIDPYYHIMPYEGRIDDF